MASRSPGNIEPSTLAAGRYEIGPVLGSGGMGIVVRARDRELDRDVAIKLLADNLAMDDDARERFTREARAAAGLNHPNVVRIFDVGEEGGRPYIVMELVDGDSLAGRDRLGGSELTVVARQALAALAHSHAAGLLHRDIKPGNLVVASDGTVKVTDFGVAEVADSEGLTRTGQVLGTLPYLAPERLRGERASVASDLYALGATLHELATGAPAKDGVALPDDLPRGLGELIARCLAEDPTERPASANAALDVLRGREPTRPIAAHDTVAMVPETKPVRTERSRRPPEGAREDLAVGDLAAQAGAWLRRQPPTRVVLASVAIVVLLALAAISGDGGAEQPPAEGEVARIERGEDGAQTARNIAEWIRRHADD